MALKNNVTTNPVTGEEVDNISQKYGRNPSRERLEERSMLSNANDSRMLNQSAFKTGASQMQYAGTPQVQMAPQSSAPILRPVSGKSNNSRYTAGTKMVTQGRPPSHMVPENEDAAGAFR